MITSILLIKVLIVLPVLAMLNRVAGGWFPKFTDKLPGRAVYWISAAYSFIALIVTANPLFAGMFGAGYLGWRVSGWGTWLDLNANDDSDDPRKDGWFVKLLDKFGNDYIALILRHLIFMLPFFVCSVVFGFLPVVAAIVIPVFASVAMTFAYHFNPNKNSYMIPEFACGAIWGLFLFLA